MIIEEKDFTRTPTASKGVVYRHIPTGVFLNSKMPISNKIGVYKGVEGEVTEKKEFDRDYQGFLDATDYYEQLIFEDQNKGKPREDRMPPIGFLFPVVRDSNKNWKVELQNGFQGYYNPDNRGDFELKDGVLKVVLSTDDSDRAVQPPTKFMAEKSSDGSKYLLYPFGDGQMEGVTFEPIGSETLNDVKFNAVNKMASQATNKAVETLTKLAEFFGFPAFPELANYFTKKQLNTEISAIPSSKMKELLKDMDLSSENLLRSLVVVAYQAVKKQKDQNEE